MEPSVSRRLTNRESPSVPAFHRTMPHADRTLRAFREHLIRRYPDGYPRPSKVVRVLERGGAWRSPSFAVLAKSSGWVVPGLAPTRDHLTASLSSAPTPPPPPRRAPCRASSAAWARPRLRE